MAVFPFVVTKVLSSGSSVLDHLYLIVRSKRAVIECFGNLLIDAIVAVGVSCPANGAENTPVVNKPAAETPGTGIMVTLKPSTRYSE